MRPLVVFLLGVVVVFGAIAAVIVLTRTTERAFVVVDSSFPMREVWNDVPGALRDVEGEDYAEFALATEKDLIHSWQPTLRWRTQTPYAPCDFAEIVTYAEAAEADVRVLITTPASCPTDTLGEWQVRLLEP